MGGHGVGMEEMKGESMVGQKMQFGQRVVNEIKNSWVFWPAITILVIGVAVFLNQETTKPLSQGRGLVFPGLMAKINEVTEFTIESTGETVTLVRQENRWGVKEKDHVSGCSGKGQKLAWLGMAELRFREPKTKNPDLYEKLGLQDHTREGSRATLVTIRANQNQETAKLLIGDQRPAKGEPQSQRDLCSETW